MKSDEEAVKLINDSPYGLTSSVWTKDEKAFNEIVDEIETGTVFMNRCGQSSLSIFCDYLFGLHLLTRVSQLTRLPRTFTPLDRSQGIWTRYLALEVWIRRRHSRKEYPRAYSLNVPDEETKMSANRRRIVHDSRWGRIVSMHVS